MAPLKVPSTFWDTPQSLRARHRDTERARETDRERERREPRYRLDYKSLSLSATS